MVSFRRQLTAGMARRI